MSLVPPENWSSATPPLRLLVEDSVGLAVDLGLLARGDRALLILLDARAFALRA